MSTVTWALVAIVIITLWLYSRWRHSYWSSRGIPTAPGLPFIGNLHKVLSLSYGRWVYDYEVYSKHGGSRMCGLYEGFNPSLMIGDPELIKQIMVKEFDHFPDRRTFRSSNSGDDVGNHMLTNVNGEQWKTTRSIMTPTFTSGKMKGMFHLVCDKADSLVSFCLAESAKKPSIDIKHAFGRFTVDTIATCAFGIECNSLVNKDAIFPKKASVFFEIKPKAIIRFVMLMMFPFIFKLFKIRLNPPELDFFKDVMKETMATRQKGQKRGDFLDLLLEAREQHLSENKGSGKGMEDLSVLAQSILFLIVGYDTTASTLAFSSYLLAKHPETQQRLRQELREMVAEHGGITYQGVMDAKYLDSCLMETLRLYPPSTTTERKCAKTYKVPGTNLAIEEGTIILIPIWCLHHDPKYWPEPEVFRPERFLPENKAEIKNFTHMPFGMGPRNCIAMRFALMEAKIALTKMVLACEMTLDPRNKELKVSTGPGLLRPLDGGVNLVISPLNEE